METPEKSTQFEKETGNLWKLISKNLYVESKNAGKQLPVFNFLRRRMAKDWYLGVCPMRVRRDSPIDTRQISLKPGSDKRIRENTRDIYVR